MVSQLSTPTELYNLRWNSYFSNLINVFNEHQSQEALVDVTLGCEGQFIKAHKLVLSACSIYFQKIFESHTNPQLLILLNDVTFKDLQLVIQFMYKGEVKVADSDMQQFLSLGKMLQVKGLCSVELQDKHKTHSNDGKSCEKGTSPINDKTSTAENKKITCNKVVQIDQKNDKETKESPSAKKRKLPSPAPPDKKKITKDSGPVDTQDLARIPRPPNAFMIFANQWRKKLAVEHPSESNKDISVRLGNMWKSLSQETKEAFYEDAKRADEEHKLKYPGPKEARFRKAIANNNKSADRTDNSPETSNENEGELIEIKFEDNDEDSLNQSTQSNGSH
ncbi:high mobility group protein B2-like isoform X2 [Tribolium madens]|uniref:high mobility group protein B2-like isoform X2 n=1 Tax=Tribolium madens TaxID=41895 RepID=UPI001CF73250|nr:high mobility group protein B2-like isoform X2 [Tribolium madens]